jgi:hypothetical protein
MSRIAVVVWIGVAVLATSQTASAEVIYSQTGGVQYLAGDQFIGVSWSQSTAWTDVAVSLDVFNTGPVGLATTATVFLLDSIGPGTTQAANEIASATISSTTPGAQVVSVFSGLALGPGTYFLAYLRSGGQVHDPLLLWQVRDTGTATTTGPGVTANNEFYRFGVPLDPYAPATAVAPYGIDPLFSVTGTPTAVPEAATTALALIAATSVGLRARRRAPPA